MLTRYSKQLQKGPVAALLNGALGMEDVAPTTATDSPAEFWLSGPYFMCLTIHEARNLAAQDKMVGSSDPFVVVSVTQKRVSKHGNASSLATDTLHTAKTRTVYRNRNPLWEQSFLWPLQGLHSEAQVRLQLFDKDLTGCDKLGLVAVSIGDLLAQLTEEAKEKEAWFPVAGEKPGDKFIASGEVRLSWGVVDKEGYELLSADLADLLDPSSLNRRLSDYHLQVSMHDAVGLKALEPHFMDKAGRSTLSYEIKLGRSLVSRTIPWPQQPLAVRASSGASAVSADSSAARAASPACPNTFPPTANGAKASASAASSPKASATAVNGPSGGSPDVSVNGKAAPADVPAATGGAAPGPAKGTGGEAGLLLIDDELFLPLSESFRPSRGRAATEAGDIKIYIKVNGATVAKTQVPIWDVPFNQDAADDATAGGNGTAPVAPAASATGVSGTSSSGGSLGLLCRQLLVGASADKKPKGAPEPAPPPPAPPLVGKSYSRMMEVYSRELHAFVMLHVSLKLTRPDAGAAAVVQVEDDAEDAPDVATAAPIAPPAELDIPLLSNVELSAGPHRLYGLLFRSNSAWLKKMAGAEGLTKVEYSPWTLDPATSTKTRTVTYVKPLKIPLPMAPKEANVTELQTLKLKEDGGFVMEAKVTTSAPKGDTFFVLVQTVGVHGGAPDKTKLSASMKVEFTGSPGLLKGAIQGGAEKDTRRFHTALLSSLRQELGQAEEGPAGGAVAGTGVTSGAPPVPPYARLAVVLLVVLSLLWLAWSVSTAGHRVARAVADLAAATREATQVSRQAAALQQRTCQNQTP